MDILDFFSRQAGQDRSRRLNKAISKFIPPNLRPLGNFLGEISPTSQLQSSSEGLLKAAERDASLSDRVGGVGQFLSGAAGVAAPMLLAPRAGMSASEAIQEGLLGASVAGKSVSDEIIPNTTKQSAADLRRQANIQRFGYDPSETTNKIMAYHGSPHTFDKFDMSKMGTGEGAQAYGRGLYFSENEAVAKNYRDALSRDIIAKIGDTPILDVYNSLIRQADSIRVPSQKSNELYEKAAFLENLEIKGSFDEALDAVENPEIAKWAKSEILPNYKPAGNIYQVEIASDVGKFIDYDAPLSEQSDFVKNALENIPKGNVKIVKNADSARPEFRDRVRPYQVVGTNWKGERVNRPARSLDQAERVKALAEGGNLRLNPDATGANLISSTPYANQEQMLNVLKGVDIQGIRYLDQGSRGMGYEVKLSQKGKPYETEPITAKTKREAEEVAKNYKAKGFDTNVQPSGTRNLVVFDDKIVDIVKKYGIAGAATLLGMSQLDVQAAMAQENRNNRGLLER